MSITHKPSLVMPLNNPLIFYPHQNHFYVKPISDKRFHPNIYLKSLTKIKLGEFRLLPSINQSFNNIENYNYGKRLIPQFHPIIRERTQINKRNVKNKNYFNKNLSLLRSISNKTNISDYIHIPFSFPYRSVKYVDKKNNFRIKARNESKMNLDSVDKAHLFRQKLTTKCKNFSMISSNPQKLFDKMKNTENSNSIIRPAFKNMKLMNLLNWDHHVLLNENEIIFHKK